MLLLVTMLSKEFLCSLFFIITKISLSVGLDDNSVNPTFVEVGDNVELYCNFNMDLAQSKLYSIKWYRDNIEFFRYIPSEEPHTTVFIMPGLELLDSSSPTHIILASVNTMTGGQFKCEVSEGPPRFSTAARITDLQIVDLPGTGPSIFGLKSVYTVGEFANLTCESGPSSPVTSLSWFMDGVKIQPQSPLVSSMTPVYLLADNKAISRIYLSLLLSDENIRRPITVRCEASIGDIYNKTTEVIVYVGQSHVTDVSEQRHTWQHWAQHFSSADHHVAGKFWTLIVTLIALTWKS